MDQPGFVSWRWVVVLGGCCAVIGLLSLIVLGEAVAVLTGYRPDVAKDVPTGNLSAAQTDRVVLVVLNGVSNAEVAAPNQPWRFLQLRRRAAEGAFGTAKAVLPSGDAPTWAALLTGTGPARTGVVESQEVDPIAVPTLFESARRRGLRSVVVSGPVAWERRELLGRPDEVAIASSGTELGATAARLLSDTGTSLVVVLVDAGRTTIRGPDERAARIEQDLTAISSELDPDRDTLIITGDHGVLADGSSGGREADVVDVPLVLWGRGIVPLALGSVDQTDIAPTIATLLGLPLPAFDGAPLFQALDLTPEQKARELVRLLDTRITTAQRVGEAIPGAATDLLGTAQESLAGIRWTEAQALAERGLASLARDLPPPWYVTSVWTWAVGVPLLLMASAWLVGRFRSRIGFLLPSLIGLVGYFILWSLIYFWLAGKTVSLSAVYGNWGGRLGEVSLWSGLVLTAAAVALAIPRADRGPLAAASLLGWTSSLILVTLGSFVLIYMLVNGWPNGELPNITGWAALLLVLAQATGVGIGAPVAMLVGAASAEVAGRGR